MANGNTDNYCRLGRSIAPFFQRVKSYLIQFITNQLPEGWWFDIEVLTTTGKSIFSG
mgnify:CR=1 FL=1